MTELRGLSSLTVGVVTCDIADFFCTRPQVIVVDITELGTIKLQLEVLWRSVGQRPPHCPLWEMPAPVVPAMWLHCSLCPPWGPTLTAS